MLKSILNRAKSMFRSSSMPQTYGSALEEYIILNQPQNVGDVDRLSREFSRIEAARANGWPQ
jgi:hypothetical protein